MCVQSLTYQTSVFPVPSCQTLSASRDQKEMPSQTLQRHSNRNVFSNLLYKVLNGDRHCVSTKNKETVDYGEAVFSLEVRKATFREEESL